MKSWIQGYFLPWDSVWASNFMQCCLIVISPFHTELILDHGNKAALQMNRGDAWLAISKLALSLLAQIPLAVSRLAWGVGKPVVLLAHAELLANMKLLKSRLLSNLSHAHSNRCVYICVCRLSKYRRWQYCGMGVWFNVEPLNRKATAVRFKASLSFPRKTSATTVCRNHKGKWLLLRGDVIFFLMFFQRRRIFCVSTWKWSNCFCKMIFI